MHAFVDESRRNDTYLLAAAIVQPRDLSRLRRHLRGLLLPGQRELHCKLEKPARRRSLLARVVEFDIRVDIHQASCRSGEEVGRQQCVAGLADALLDVEARRVVFDSRSGRDKHDEITIRRALRKQAREAQVVYEHMDSANEPLLWLADMTAWCFGAGGEWSKRIAPVLGTVTRHDRP